MCVVCVPPLPELMQAVTGWALPFPPTAAVPGTHPAFSPPEGYIIQGKKDIGEREKAGKGTGDKKKQGKKILLTSSGMTGLIRPPAPPPEPH